MSKQPGKQARIRERNIRGVEALGYKCQRRGLEYFAFFHIGKFPPWVFVTRTGAVFVSDGAGTFDKAHAPERDFLAAVLEAAGEHDPGPPV